MMIGNSHFDGEENGFECHENGWPNAKSWLKKPEWLKTEENARQTLRLPRGGHGIEVYACAQNQLCRNYTKSIVIEMVYAPVTRM